MRREKEDVMQREDSFTTGSTEKRVKERIYREERKYCHLRNWLCIFGGYYRDADDELAAKITNALDEMGKTVNNILVLRALIKASQAVVGAGSSGLTITFLDEPIPLEDDIADEFKLPTLTLAYTGDELKMRAVVRERKRMLREAIDWDSYRTIWQRHRLRYSHSHELLSRGRRGRSGHRIRRGRGE